MPVLCSVWLIAQTYPQWPQTPPPSAAALNSEGSRPKLLMRGCSNRDLSSTREHFVHSLIVTLP